MSGGRAPLTVADTACGKLQTYLMSQQDHLELVLWTGVGGPGQCQRH